MAYLWYLTLKDNFACVENEHGYNTVIEWNVINSDGIFRVAGFRYTLTKWFFVDTRLQSNIILNKRIFNTNECLIVLTGELAAHPFDDE